MRFRGFSRTFPPRIFAPACSLHIAAQALASFAADDESSMCAADGALFSWRSFLFSVCSSLLLRGTEAGGKTWIKRLGGFGDGIGGK
uniref:Uncharacterized protein n=1 Tax=Arundo donax TaxID=35708 RepID=A0A0A9FB02_ARUDO